jgi:hypothetical protein
MEPTTEQPNNGSTTLTPPEETGNNSPKRADDGRLLPGTPSLNPNGRPKGSVSITEAIKRKLEEKYPKRECFCNCHNKGETIEPFCIECRGFHEAQLNFAEKKTYLESIVDVVFDNGLIKKDQRTVKDIWAYIDGLPKGSFDVGVDREGLAELTEFMKVLANPKKE